MLQKFEALFLNTGTVHNKFFTGSEKEQAQRVNSASSFLIGVFLLPSLIKCTTVDLMRGK